MNGDDTETLGDIDPDNPPLDETFFARARPAREGVPHLVRRHRGAQAAPTKEAISIRLDPDVLAYFRNTGPGWQGRINAMLRAAMDKR